MDEGVPDEELVRRAAAGGAAGADAEEALCRRFAPRIRLYGLRHLRDEERALDLVQAVLIALIEAVRAGRVAEPAHVDRFVLGTCRHVAGRVREREGRARPLPPDEVAVAGRLVDVPAERLDPAPLARCLDALDERAKKVLMLSFHDERSADEVATALGTTAGNVRVLRHRAIASLRRCLDVGGEARP